MRKGLLVAFLFLLPLFTDAQRFYGVGTSNWSGTNSIYLNPANVADSRHRFVIDLFSLNMGVDNDQAQLASSSLFRGDSFNVGKVLEFRPDVKKFNLTAPYAEVRGPGFMWSINKKMGVALTTRVRIYNQLQDFDRNLYGLIVDESYRNINGNFALTSSRFNWNMNAWSEIGGSFGMVLLDKGKHFLKGGVTLRYLGGFGYINLHADSLNGQYFQANDSLQISGTKLTFSSNIVKEEDQVSGALTGSNLADYFFGAKGGNGLGIDLGFVYEWRPKNESFRYDLDGVKGIQDNTVNRYKLRISAAITDFGTLIYNKGNKVASISGTGSVIGSELSNHNSNFQEFREYMLSRGLTVDSFNTRTVVNLPTALQFGIDYNIGHDFYANLAFNANMVDRFKPGNIFYSQITFTPRYDRRLLSFGLPVTYNTFSQKVKLGAGFRISGFFIGSDDMLAFLGNKSQTGANFYMGASIPVNKRRPRDRDHDGVSDKRDSCIDLKGPWENNGCPIYDRDKDGVPDSLDKCPDVFGASTAKGCPDADRDSVEDAMDRCPDKPGLVRFAGCPDSDNDGIPDIDDDCPDGPGLAKFKGCPDTDGDGIPDNLDLCPEKPGVAALNGCPDTDGDGVPDHKDKCPTMPGTIANQGCPEVKKEVIKRLAFAATAIQFETGKDVIRTKSYPLLDEIVKILKEYSDYSMKIEGHTDNVGDPEANLILSKERALSVRNYFVIKGIAESRLVTDGFGESQPAASNNTETGRAKNRRVVMSLFVPEQAAEKEK